MAPQGWPRDTIGQRNRRRRQREAHRRKLQQAAQRLRDAAGQAEKEGQPRRSLRILSQEYNREYIAAGLGPRFTFVLFGEEGWDVNYDIEEYQIRSNYDLIIPRRG